MSHASTSDSIMRILHTESSVGLGGQEYRILHEVVGMQKRGHQVYLAVSPISQLATHAQEQGVPIFPLTMTMWHFGFLIYQFMKIYSEYDIEIVNTHGSIDSWTASIAGRLSKRAPVIIRSRHKSTPVSASLRHRWLYSKLPHAVITTGETVRQGLIQNCRVKPSQIFSIPTGVDLLKFYPREPDCNLKKSLGIVEGRRVVGSITFLRAYKGVDVFLEAAANVVSRDPHVIFLVIGGGTERDALERLAYDLGIGNRVCFLGFRNDIPQLLSIMDVVVLSSIGTEGIPQILTQALAMERPVVATRVGGIPEIIKNNENGLLVSPCNPQQICSAIFQLLNDPAMRRKFGKAGRAMVGDYFSHDKMLDHTVELYQKVLKEGPLSVSGEFAG